MSRYLPARPAFYLALAAGALSLSACSGPSSSTPSASPPADSSAGSSSGKSYRLGSTIPTFSHPFFVAMKKGLEEEAQAQGATINVVDGKDDAQAQISAVDNFVVQKMDAILLCPTESETLPPAVEKANSAGIPVVTVNRTVSSGSVVTYVGADDTEGGRLQGRAVMEALPNGGKIVLLQGILGSSPQRNREAGLEEALRGKGRYQIVEKIPYKFQRTEAVSAMERVLTQYPKGGIDAVVAQSDDGALAAIDVAGQKGRGELVIIGFNGESDAFDAVKAGTMYATVLQDAETQGREAVRDAIKHLKGEQVENPHITPLHLITKKNIAEHQPAWQSAGS